MDLNDKEESGAGTKIFGENEPSLKYGSKKQVVKGGILGFFIGLAVIVPGVSGSAVAVIFGLYEKLLYAFGNFFRRFKVCALFLLPVAIGLAAGFALGFFGVRELLNLLPFVTVALFAGLMTGAYPAVTDKLKGARPTKMQAVLFAAGLIIPVLVSAVTAFTAAGSALSTIAVHISRLREKLEDNPSEPRHIVTVRGAGYRFV